MQNIISFDCETTGLSPSDSRITCICVKTEKEKYTFADQDEAKILMDFWKFVNKNIEKLFVGFNVMFDVDFVLIRSLKNGICVRKFFIEDVRDILNIKREYRFKGTLEYWADFFDVDHNGNLIGSDMPKLFEQGKIDIIKEHCEDDVRTVFELYKKLKNLGLVDVYRKKYDKYV